MPERRAVVIGAGIGGLVAALELARRGIAVTVVERASAPGGKLREVLVGGQPIDAGPTVFTLRSVFEEIFTAAGSSIHTELRLTPLQTLARHAWDATQQLDLHADLERCAEAIGDFAGAAEAERYRRFCVRAQGIYDTLEGPFIKGSRPNPLSLVTRIARNGLGGLARIQPFGSLWQALGREFRDPRLQQLFGRYATYMGSSPFSAPATLMLIAHVERTGVWTVDGGMHQLARALERLATAHGATFRYATEARQIVTRQRRVIGVELADEEMLDTDTVIVNADAAALSSGKLGQDVRDAVAAQPPTQRSLSALTWSLVASTQGFPLHHHSVFFSADYAREFREILGQKRLPTSPTVYVCAQDRNDQQRLAAGQPERLFCLVNAPAVGDQAIPDGEAIEQCRQRSFALLQRCGLQIAYDADACKVTGPAQFERLFPGTGGALYGPASHGWQASFRRPGARTRYAGLYLAGGSVHPGAGLPMAALSGRQAVATLVADWNHK